MTQRDIDIDHLQARIAVLRADLAKVTAERDMLREALLRATEPMKRAIRKHAELTAERDALLAENATLREDKMRLDWLDGLRKSSPWQWGLSLHDPECVFFGKNTSSGHATARAAIDAAKGGAR